MLPGLPLGVERARYLGTAKGAVVEQTAVFAREGHALGHALVDNAAADLRQPMHIGFARAVVAAFNGVVEQPPHAVAVVGVVLRRVDASLGGNAVGAAGRVLNAKAFDVVAQLRQGGRCRGPR